MDKKLAVNLLLGPLKGMHQALEGTMEGVTDEVASHMPPGKANPIAGTYMHLVMSEDMFVQGLIKGEKPLFETAWKDKTGASEVQPTDWQEAYPKWLKEVKVDMKQAQEYAKAVFAATQEYLASLSDEDLTSNVDMSSFGGGQMSVGSILGEYVIGHGYSIMGEIAVLKGIQDLKGYPF